MARVTRSKKTIEVAEDHTAIAIQTPLPNTPAKPPALSDIHNTMGATNLSVSDNVQKELKDLKAAYRDALGAAKRGRKGKGRKKGKQESEVDSEDTQDTQESIIDVSIGPAVNPGPEVTRQLLQSREGSLASLLTKMAALNLTTLPEDLSASQQQQAQPIAPVRTTRRQLAIAQAGQYNSSNSSGVQEPAASRAQKFRGFNFTSLFGGRCTGSYRANNGFECRGGNTSGELMTDNYLSLAGEEISKSLSREINVEVVSISSPTDTSTECKEAADRIDTKSISIFNNPGRSPKKKTLEEVELACASAETVQPAEDGGEDSFVQEITCRSPAKPVSRIEDSVEALDQLEEALEALDQVTMAERMFSPQGINGRNHQAKPAEHRQNEKEGEFKASRKQNSAKGQQTKPGFSSMRVKPTTAKHAPSLKKAASMNFGTAAEMSKPTEEATKMHPPTRAPVRRPISLLPPKEPAKSTKPPTRSTFQLPGEAVAQRLKEQREARRAQRESSEESFHTARAVSGPRPKSIYASTRPTFTLPGEAISQRKREAHEAKLRAQEEEERRRREFKARPIRNSIAPSYVPRETVASLARRSMAGIEGVDLGDLAGSKRGSTVVGAHRPSLAAAAMANTSAPRTKVVAPVRKPSPTVHGPSMSGKALQRSVSVTDVQAQRQRAREIYNRDNKFAEDMEREKRDREIAAKRAREEAAERGRHASREWAEKQLAKKISGGDKGLMAGYGPGGQLGLRS